MRNICEVEECSKFVASHGLCDTHRKRMARHGHLKPTRAHDWGDREKHPLYSLWVGIKRSRSKKISSEWASDFWLFASDVKKRPSKYHQLRPIEHDKNLCVENFHWVERIIHESGEDKKAYQRQWSREDRKRNPRKYKDQSLRKSYGINIEEFELMQRNQGNRCAICRKEETAKNPKTGDVRDLAVDHCHDTDKVRELLCGQCNTAIGSFKDDIELLKQAVLYLEKHGA